MRLTRTDAQVRTGPADMLTIARQNLRVGHHDQFGVLAGVRRRGGHFERPVNASMEW